MCALCAYDVRDFRHKMNCICARCDLSKTKPQYAREREEPTHSHLVCGSEMKKLLHINELFKQLGTVLFALDNKIKHTPDQMEKPLVFFKLLNDFFLLLFVVVFSESRNISEKKKKRRRRNRDDKSKIKKKWKRNSENGSTSYATLESSLVGCRYRLKTQIKLLLCQTHTFAYGIEMRSIIPSIT